LVTETWFSDKHLDQHLALEGYKLFRRDRVNRSGGGVCFYVRNEVDSCVVNFGKMPTHFEKLWLKFSYSNTVYYVACCYHPPSPRYQPADFITEIIEDIDCILRLKGSSPTIFIAGDFNNLNTNFLEETCGLSLIVHNITHGKRILDKVFTNRVDMFYSCVFKSLLKTKHMAVVVNSIHTPNFAPNIVRRKVKVYDVRAHVIDKLRAAIAYSDWSDVYNCVDVSQMYGLFLQKCNYIIEHCVPVKAVSLGPRDPKFITPLIKSLLRSRNKLRRAGKLEKANLLAAKINQLIAQERSNSLAKLETAGPKKLWEAVHKSNGSQKQGEQHPLLADLNVVNDYFANISFDNNYSMLHAYNHDNSVERSGFVGPVEIEKHLKSLKPTAAGPDGLPRWFFHGCSVELADVVSHIVSHSLSSGTVPHQWKVAYVSPVRKVGNPATLNDFRPISVTSILSRVTEKLVVRKWLLPALPAGDIDDQFGFRPTGSTTSALVYFMHHVTRLLETNKYVRCLCVDFSKAFDVVDHGILSEKLARLSLPENIFMWLLSFLTGRSQQVKLNDVLSKPKPINKGTVQGSVLGPTDYVIMASDLRSLSRIINKLFKYADDTTLVVPQFTDVSLEDEFKNIETWANTNKMIINKAKTKELVFHRPDPRLYVPPDPISDVERVTCIKLLGVYFSETLRFDEHVKYLLTLCNQRCFLLKTLRAQGMSPKHINSVFQSLIISRVVYALPAWGGFLTKDLVNKIDAFLKKSAKYGYTSTLHEYDVLLDKYDSTLFDNLQNDNHCINCLLPNKKSIAMSLRKTRFELPKYIYKLFRNSFILRTVYKGNY